MPTNVSWWSCLWIGICLCSACSNLPQASPVDANDAAIAARRAEGPDDLDANFAELEHLRRRLTQLDAAVAAQPDDPALRRQRGELGLQFARHEAAGTATQRSFAREDAIADLERARARGDDTAATRLSLAMGHGEAGHAGTAFALALSLLAEPTLDEAQRTTACELLVAEADACGQLPAAIAALAGDDAQSRWFRGKARYLAALRARTGTDAATVDRGFAEAEADFAAAMATTPEFAASCRTWRAMCLACRGQRAFAAGQLDAAEELLLAAVTTGPDALHLDLGDGDSLLRCLLRHGDRIMRDFGRTEAFFRRAFAAAPNDPDLANNAAVYARDHGYRLAKAGRNDEARAMFARSYTTYHAAVALVPDSVRLRNDCALVAIHYLHTDLPAAGAMLQAAIVDGERQLAAAAPDATVRRDLEEAVGDCWENLALWHLEHTHDRAAAAAAAKRALALHPGSARTGAQRHLAAATSDAGASANGHANDRPDAP